MGSPSPVPDPFGDASREGEEANEEWDGSGGTGEAAKRSSGSSSSRSLARARSDSAARASH